MGHTGVKVQLVFTKFFLKETRFTQSGSLSQLIYSPYHELDYGTILCWATNNLGDQEQPCTFHIIPAGLSQLFSIVLKNIFNEGKCKLS